MSDSAKEVKALGFFEGLCWVSSLGMSNVIFELDSKVVIDAVNNKKEDIIEFGSLISLYREIVLQIALGMLSLLGYKRIWLLISLLGHHVLMLVPWFLWIYLYVFDFSLRYFILVNE